MKLSESQQELYDAMLGGTTCIYMPFMGKFNPSSYYFRNDTHGRCTSQARALLKRGLVEITKKDWRGHVLVAIPIGVKE